MRQSYQTSHFRKPKGYAKRLADARAFERTPPNMILREDGTLEPQKAKPTGKLMRVRARVRLGQTLTSYLREDQHEHGFAVALVLRAGRMVQKLSPTPGLEVEVQHASREDRPRVKGLPSIPRIARAAQLTWRHEHLRSLGR